MYPAYFVTPGVRQFAYDIDAERQAQITKFGDQHHPDGTVDDFTSRTMRDSARMICEARAARGAVSWVDVLDEEYWEARAETDPAKLRAELVQVAAVCAAWIADIDSRGAAEEPPAACAKCRQPFDPTDTRFDGRAQHATTPYCRACVDFCHDTEIADHRCVICA